MIDLFQLRHVILIVIIGLSLAVTVVIMNRRSSNTMMSADPIEIPSLNRSKWDDEKLVVIPAIWKEIDWANQSSWPAWLLAGFKPQSSYRVHLYQRIDPNSTAPYDWPYCPNLHEEAGVYLKFIHDYYYDLPKKMLFIHGDPFVYGPFPIAAAQCVRDDVHYTSINSEWVTGRAWNIWENAENDTIERMYRCASYLLGLFGFDGESQLNPKNLVDKTNSTVTAPCCAQFFVTRERIQHYTYEQWSAIYRANQRTYCVSPGDTEIPGERGTKWFASSLQHLWHIILGLHPNEISLPKSKTASDLCHVFRSSCNGSPCLN